jgi:hypothetical protein
MRMGKQYDNTKGIQTRLIPDSPEPPDSPPEEPPSSELTDNDRKTYEKVVENEEKLSSQYQSGQSDESAMDYPPSCYYCEECFNGIGKQGYEKHVLNKHPEKPCYPGLADIEKTFVSCKGNVVGNMKRSKNMNKNINNNTKKSNENINDIVIVNQTQARDGLHNSGPNVINRNYGHFDLEINQDFIEENKKINLNLVRHGQNSKKKFAAFTRSQRRKRRMEVYKLHFEHGVPATRIAELMKVDRNTINNDLKILYREALNDYSPDEMSLDDILQKQLLRLETQRDRLCLYLSDAKDINSKIAIERLIADIDFKLIGAIEKVKNNVGRFWEEIIKEINRIAEEKKLNIRYTSLFELQKISIDSRKSLNKLKEEVLNEKKHV